MTYTAISWRTAPLDGLNLHIYNRRAVPRPGFYEMGDEFPCGLLGFHLGILAWTCMIGGLQ